MSGYVYFITMEPDEFVKIGFTSVHPTSRMGALQTGCPHPLSLRCYFPGTMEDERRLHETFAEIRYRGEWFYVEDKLADLIGYMEDRHAPLRTRQFFEGAIHDCVLNDAGPWSVSETCNASLWDYLQAEPA